MWQFSSKVQVLEWRILQSDKFFFFAETWSGLLINLLVESFSHKYKLVVFTEV